MFFSYKLLPMTDIATCRLEEHILDNQIGFGFRKSLLTPSDIQEAATLKVTCKISKKYESNDKNGLIKHITSLINLISNYDFITIPGFLENRIPEIFLDLLNKDDIELNNLIVSLIAKLTIYPQLFQHFLTRGYIECITRYFKTANVTNITFDYFLYLKNILIISTNQADFQFLIDNSIIKIICDYSKILANVEFIDICFDILILLSSIHLEKEQITDMFNFINFILYGSISHSSNIVKIFKILNNLFISDSIIFDLFEDNGYIELIQCHLNKPSEIATYYSCLLISQIYTKFNCKSQFHMRKLLEIIISEEYNNPAIEKCSTAASNALFAQLTAMPHLASFLMNDNSFQQLFQAAQRKSLLSKISIMKIFLCLIKESTKENFFKVFTVDQKISRNQKQHNHAFFQFITDMADGNNTSLKISLKLLLLIFEKSNLFGTIDGCKENFLKVFSEDFFEKMDSFEDGEIIYDFQKLRNYFPR